MKPTLVVIGLGNPGKSYERTRHNAGFLAIDALSEAFGVGEWDEKQKFQASVQEARIVTVPVLLVKPATFMNNSGDAIRKIVDFYKLDPAEQILVLCDDIDLPLGELRFRKKGGPGTHNGLRSIEPIYGETYPRLRIGLGTRPPEFDLAAWVLSVPTDDEKKELEAAFMKVPEVVKEYVLGKH